jgi:hypothetical protein
MTKQETPLFEQPLFRGIVVGGTALPLAIMLGSLALVCGRDATGFVWKWSWWSFPWFAGGVILVRSFWRAVFRLQSAPSHENKAKLVYHIFALVLLGVGAFLYPVRFLEQEHYQSIARGLFTAFVFLGAVVLMLFKVGQGLFATKLADGQSS